MKEKSQIVLFKSKNTVFTARDLAVLWGIINYDYLKTKIAYYIKKGYLHRIYHGVYAKDKDNFDKFELGNKLRTPSYISLETVLAKEGVIFQYYSSVFLISYFTKIIKVGNAEFNYKKIKDEVLFNREGLINEDNYIIASRERAFLDAVYLYKNYYFDNIDSLDWDKIFSLVKIYKSKALEKRIKKYYKDAEK